MSSVKRDNNNIVISASNLILDIEGTTSSISFVKDVLFPHVRKNLEAYVNKNWDSAGFQEVVESLRTQSKEDKEKQVEGVIAIPESGDKDELAKTVIENVTWQMDNDRKTKSLKDLQGLIMEEGYKQGDLKGHVYDDVEPSLKSWTEQDKSVYIYSSGSIHAQKLLFGHSVKGDLLPFIKGHFDTSVGMKGDMTSYKKILEDISSSPSEAVFFTDIPKEARAAKEAGLSAILLSREGNSPLIKEDTTEFPVITSFTEIEFELGSKKRKICIDNDVTSENKSVESCTVSVGGEIHPNDPKLTTNGIEMMEVDENPEEETTKKDELGSGNGTSLGEEEAKETNGDGNSKLDENKDNTGAVCDKKVEEIELGSKEKLESVASKKDNAVDENLKSANNELLNGKKEKTDPNLNGKNETSKLVSEIKELEQATVKVKSTERVGETLDKDLEESVKDISKEGPVAEVNNCPPEKNTTVQKQGEPSNSNIQEEKVDVKTDSIVKENTKVPSTSVEVSLKSTASSDSTSQDKIEETDIKVEKSINVTTKNSCENAEILETPPDSSDAGSNLNECESLLEMKDAKSPNKQESLIEKSSEETNNTKNSQETQDVFLVKKTDSDPKLNSVTEDCQPKDSKLPEIIVADQIEDGLSEKSSNKSSCVTETTKVSEIVQSDLVPSQDPLITRSDPHIKPYSEKFVEAESETKLTDLAQKEDGPAQETQSSPQIESQSSESMESKSETKETVTGEKEDNSPEECKIKETEQQSHPKVESCSKELMEIKSLTKQTDSAQKKDNPPAADKDKSNLKIESLSEELMETDSEIKPTDLVQKEDNPLEDCKTKEKSSSLEQKSDELMETDSEIKQKDLGKEKDSSSEELKAKEEGSNLGSESKEVMETDSEIKQKDLGKEKDSSSEELKAKEEGSNLGSESKEVMETDSEIKETDLAKKEDSSPEQCKVEEGKAEIEIESKLEEVMETESEIKQTQIQKETGASEKCITSNKDPNPQIKSDPKIFTEKESVELPAKQDSPHEECKSTEVDKITGVPSKEDGDNEPTKIVCDSKEKKTETSDSSPNVDVNGLTKKKSEVDLSNTETNVPSVAKTDSNNEEKTQLEIKNKNEPTNHGEISQNGTLSNGVAGKSLNGTSSPSPEKEISNENDVTQTTSFEGKKCDSSENSVMETVVEA